MNHEEFSAFLTFYYRAPDPARAPVALAYFVASPLAADESSRPVAAYFFRRIPQEHPELAASYLSALGGATLEGRRFVRDLFYTGQDRKSFFVCRASGRSFGHEL